jgi:voltage-gated potassium channel
MSATPRPRVQTWYERLTLVRAVGTILAIATTVTVAAGIVARIVEPDTFRTLGLSVWWALTTVTTVGYGDIVPHDTPGRIVGSVLMLTGLALIPTTTTVVVSLLLTKFTREAQREEAERLARMEERIEKLLEQAERPR